jgi:hypothetical protein
MDICLEKSWIYHAILRCVHGWNSRKLLPILGPCLQNEPIHDSWMQHILLFIFSNFSNISKRLISHDDRILRSNLLRHTLRTIFTVFWSYSLLVIFKEYQNGEPSDFFSRLIGAAYATYILHQWIVVPLAAGLAYSNMHPTLVMLILSGVSPFLDWGAGFLLKAIPGASMVL